MRYRPYGADNDDDPADRRDQVRAVIDAVDELGRRRAGRRARLPERRAGDPRHRRRPARRTRPASTPRCCRCTPGCRRPSSTASSSRIAAAGSCCRPTSPRPRSRCPGVRYVVDAGTARISRYSRRLKVQRLPIEPVSQASADQRAGRCGRVAPGICIRLYAEEDFDARPEFTEPEILRTNLASVILQMTAIGLGDVDRFPFVEPPDSCGDPRRVPAARGARRARARARSVRPRKLTTIGTPAGAAAGRPPARPDGHRGRTPRLRPRGAGDRGRPVDPGRPRAAQGVARAGSRTAPSLRRRGLGPAVDRRAVGLPPRAASGSCRATSSGGCAATSTSTTSGSREWRDLYSQLRQVAGQLDIRPTSTSRHPDHVHRAVLSGLLSHIGVRRTATGASSAAPVTRGSSIAPGSVLGETSEPKWVMAAELVETNRLWARRVADDPARVGRAARRAPGQAVVRRPVVGRQGRPGRRRRDRHAVRPPDRQRPHDRRRPGRSRNSPGRCSSGTRWSPATGTTDTTSSTANARFVERVAAARGPRPSHRPARRRERCSSSTTSGSAADVTSGTPLRPMVEDRSTRATPTCSTSTPSVLAGNRRGIRPRRLPRRRGGTATRSTG